MKKDKKQENTKMQESVEKWYECIVENYENPERIFQTEFENLDRIIGGMSLTDLMVVGGSPSSGKTSFVLDIIRNISFPKGKNSLLLSTDLSRHDLISRFFSSEAKVDCTNARIGRRMSEEGFYRMGPFFDEMVNSPISFVTGYPPCVENIVEHLEKTTKTEKPNLIVIDNVQALETEDPQVQNLNERITIVMQKLKQIALEYEIPIIAVSQLSRGVENRENYSPRLSDLRDSGSIENVADIVCLLKMDSESHKTRVSVAKNRHGRTGYTDLQFLPEYVSFTECEE